MTASLQYEVKSRVIPGRAHAAFTGYTTPKIRRKESLPQAKDATEKGSSYTKLHWTYALAFLHYGLE
jgi:hypothetical protein